MISRSISFWRLPPPKKAAALLTLEYLKERAGRGDPKLFDRLLKRVPDVPTMTGDELPTAKGKNRKPARK
jgi:hypothetical protein